MGEGGRVHRKKCQMEGEFKERHVKMECGPVWETADPSVVVWLCVAVGWVTVIVGSVGPGLDRMALGHEAGWQRSGLTGPPAGSASSSGSPLKLPQ